VQSPSSVVDFGAFLFDEGSSVSWMLPVTEGARREVSLCVDSVVLSPVPQGFSELSQLAVADDLAMDVLSSSLSSPAKDGSGLVDSLAAQEEVKLVSWRKKFRRIPYKPFLPIVQGALKTGVSRMEAAYPGAQQGVSCEFDGL